MSHPSTYRAAQISKKGGKFEIVNKDWTDAKAGQVIVKVQACGVCHSDALVVDDAMGIAYPRVPGHEIIGTVVQIGEGEKLWKVGQTVGGGWHGGHCHVCDSCRRGDFITCSAGSVNGISTDGGYAEYVTLRSEAIAAIPDGLDAADAAPLLCAGVTVYNSLRNMNVYAGDVVAVQGIGGLGHLAIQYCRAMGYRTVALSSGSDKEKLARELGAHNYLNGAEVDQAAELQKLGGAKVILATAPNGKVMETLINGLAVDGQLVILAVAEGLTIPAVPMIMKRLSIRGWPSGTNFDSEDCLKFSKLEGVNCRIEKFKLDDVQKAYDSMMEGKARFRAVLTF